MNVFELKAKQINILFVLSFPCCIMLVTVQAKSCNVKKAVYGKIRLKRLYVFLDFIKNPLFLATNSIIAPASNPPAMPTANPTNKLFRNEPIKKPTPIPTGT